MNSKNCNIISDLLPAYIENSVTSDTREFIEKHINQCNECKKVLDIMKEDIIGEQEKMKGNTKIEIEKIKKVKRKLNVHKTIIVISSIILVVLCSIFLYKEMNKPLFEKIYQVYEKNMALSNHRLIMKHTYKNYVENEEDNVVDDTYCKDGKYVNYTYYTDKITDINDKDATEIEYGEIGSGEYIKIWKNSKEIVKFNNYKNENPHNYTSYEASLKKFKNKEVEIKKNDGKEWYVYREDYNDGYKEYWIDKENLTDIRIVESYDKYYREIYYIFEKNTVTDENMNIDYDTTEYEYKEINPYGNDL